MGKIITTHLTIDAAVTAVWGTVSDLAGYQVWNPFITSAAGVLAVGERLKLTIRPPGSRSMTFKPWVTAVEQYRYLEWLGHLAVPGIFDGRHSLKLTALPGDRTLIQQSETFHGLMTPFATSLLTRTRAGFEAMNDALARQTSATTKRPVPPETST